MNYMVRGSDGKDYGPVDEATLRGWAQENRIYPQTELRETVSDRMMPASSVPGLFAATAPPVPSVPPIGGMPGPAAPYPRAGMPMGMMPAQNRVSSGNAILVGILLRCVAALAFFFIFHGIGIIFAGYALFYAWQAKQEDHEHGTIALVIAGVTFLIVAVGWVMRFTGTGRF